MMKIVSPFHSGRFPICLKEYTSDLVCAFELNSCFSNLIWLWQVNLNRMSLFFLWSPITVSIKSAMMSWMLSSLTGSSDWCVWDLSSFHSKRKLYATILNIEIILILASRTSVASHFFLLKHIHHCLPPYDPQVQQAGFIL